MEINYKLILFASVLNFILGGLWYSPIMFGKWWAQIMEMSHHTKEEMQKMQKEMMPFYILQFFLALIFTWELAHALASAVEVNHYFLAFITWFGFVMPIQVGSVVWGNTKKKFWPKQLFVMLSYQLVSIIISTWVLTM
jgi:hypothetical protein